MNSVASELLDVLTHQCDVDAAVWHDPDGPYDVRWEIDAVGHDGQLYHVEAPDALTGVILFAELLGVDLSDI